MSGLVSTTGGPYDSGTLLFSQIIHDFVSSGQTVVNESGEDEGNGMLLVVSDSSTDGAALESWCGLAFPLTTGHSWLSLTAI